MGRQSAGQACVEEAGLAKGSQSIMRQRIGCPLVHPPARIIAGPRVKHMPQYLRIDAAVGTGTVLAGDLDRL
jgi:hypothetical protein